MVIEPLVHAPLIATLATALGLALVMGFVATKLKLPALVGYLLAGILIGPSTPGLVADPAIASQLAELGVMLLMFGVGLHFSLADLSQVRKVALPGALVQMAVATALGTGMGILWGWPIGGALVLGLSLSVASTVVLLRALDSRRMLDSVNARIAVGWLVVEDLAIVFVLVLLPATSAWLNGAHEVESFALWKALGLTAGKVAAFVVLMILVGRRVFPWLLWQVTRTGSRELFNLCVIAGAVSLAYAASMLFSVSLALGAFFAGMVIRESAFSHRVAEESLPMRDAFASLFFVSVGMLFDPAVILSRPLQVLAIVGVVVVGKSIAAGLLVLAMRYPLGTAMTVSASLAQIGEFSFVLAGLGASLGLLPPEGLSMILAAALFSIALNPLLFKAIDPALRWLHTRSATARRLERLDDPLTELPMSTDEKFLSRHIVLIGRGRVGGRIAETLDRTGIPYVVVDSNRELVERLRERGGAAVWGEASNPAVLVQAHIVNASMLVIATPDTLDVRRMVETARMVNPGVEIVVRTHNQEEGELLEREQAGKVFVGEHALAESMCRHLLERFGATHPRETRKAAG